MSSALKKSRTKKIIAIKLFISKFIKDARLIHALTDNEKRDILNLEKNIDVIVIPNGVNSDLNNFSYKEDVHKNVKILFLGRVDVYGKGLDLLVNAVSILENKNFPVTFSLNIVGPYQTKNDKKFIEKSLKKHKNIIYSGPVFGELKYQEIYKSDILILPSRSEGMPMVILEAMQLKKPVIVTENCNVSEIVKESNSGFIISDDIEKFVDQLKCILLYDKTVLKNMGLSGYEWSKKYLDWKVINEKYRDLYLNVIRH